jgi:hypothetical protein
MHTTESLVAAAGAVAQTSAWSRVPAHLQPAVRKEQHAHNRVTSELVQLLQLLDRQNCTRLHILCQQ